MSTASPTAFLLWAILSVLFLGFLIYHLWSYDRFKCLYWSAGRQPGAFKRIMTYSYLSSVPLLVVYSVATTVIKFQEGFIMLHDHRIIPRPMDLYSPKNRDWIVPLGFVFAFAWGLELVTHLEELAFWLYLLHQNPRKAEWFESWEYRMWYLGSMVAFIGMPLTALVARRDVMTQDAYIFLVGSSGSTCTTLCFLYVLWEFPRFLKHVKSEGADPVVVVRLATFYNLNLARVVFRFLFTVPLFIVALDGIMGAHQINKSIFWTDFLLMIAGIGCFVSTTITLLIFFPRSFTKEAGYKPRPPTAANSPKTPPFTPNAASRSRPVSGWSGHHPSVPATPQVASPAESRWGSQYYPADSQPQATEDDGEAYDEVYSAEAGQQPWYSDEAPPYHTQVEPSSSVQYGVHSAYPEQAAYHRQPFPHATSSPQIAAFPLSPPPVSPAPAFMSHPQDPPAPSPSPMSPPAARIPRRASQRKSNMNQMATPAEVLRYSSGQPRPRSGPAGLGMSMPEEDASTSSIVKPAANVSTTIHEIPMRNTVLQSNTNVRRQASKSSLHPYVMTFTSPIDLADLNPPEFREPRRSV